MLKHASVFISLILAGLYVLGLTFQQGFFRELGLEETQFALSVDRTFFQGFMSAAQMGGRGFLYLIGSAASVAIMAELGVFALNWINKTDLRKKLFKRNTKTSTKQEQNSFVDFSLKAFSYIVVAFILYTFLLVALVFSDKSGIEWAVKFKENAMSGKYTVKSIKLHKDTEPRKGYSIICNNLQCAYLVDGTSIIFNNRDVEWVKSE